MTNPSAPNKPTISEIRAANIAKARAARAANLEARRAAAAEAAPVDIEAHAEPIPQRAARSAPRETYPRSPVREPARGGVTVRGRGGEVLTRKRPSVGDEYEIPEAILRQYAAEGYALQWNPYTTVNKIEGEAQHHMYENGWRNVPAERHPGLFSPAGDKGAIIRGGVILQERPIELNEWARQDEFNKAKGQMKDNIQQFMKGKSNRNPSDVMDGFTMSAPNARNASKLNMSIDPGLDIPRPAYEPAESE